MNNNKKGIRSLRTRLFDVLTVVLIIAVLALNLLMPGLGLRKSLYVDLTPEGLYSLTDAMIRECSFVEDLEDEVTITFCADPDQLIASDITRLTYFMALQLEKRFDNIKVEEVNVIYEPTKVSKYKPTSLSVIDPGDVIISYGGRYRIQKPISFWAGSEEALSSYNGEYKMASYLLSVTAVERPVAYFTVGHGETYFDSSNPSREENHKAQALYDLLAGRGLEVKTVNLAEAGEVPEDCVLLVINNPREDFELDPDKLNDLSYRSEIEMIDRYLVTRQGSVMVARDHALLEDGSSRHPALDAFLADWGFCFSDTVVGDKENHIEANDESIDTILGEYSTDEDSFGALVYSNFASLPSAAGVIFDDAGYIKSSFKEGDALVEAGNSSERMFMEFMSSFDSAVAMAKSPEGEYNSPENNGKLILAAMTGRYQLDSYTNTATRSNIFCVNSASFFSNEVLGNYSYANSEIMALLVEEMIFNDRYASSELGGTSMNFDNYGGKFLADTTLKISAEKTEVKAISTVLFLLPVAALAAGVVVYVKRRYL